MIDSLFKSLTIRWLRSCIIIAALAGAVHAAPVLPELPPDAVVEGTVTVVSAVPDPSKAGYADCLTHFKLAVDNVVSGKPEDHDILAVTWAFRDFKLEEAAGFHVGDRLRLQIADFGKVEAPLAQEMRVDDTNDLESPLSWVIAAEVLGRGEAPLVEAVPPQPAPVQSARPSGIVASNPKTQQVLDILRLHGWDLILTRANGFVFHRQNTITTPEFWKKRTPQSECPRCLSPLEAIIEFHDYLARRNVELVMLFPPVADAIYPDIATNTDYDPVKDGRVDETFLPFFQELRSAGIRCVDILPDICEQRWQQHDGATYPVYIPTDGHWTSVAQEIAAARVAEVIKELPWYAEAASAAGHGSTTPRVERRIDSVTGFFAKTRPDLGLGPVDVLEASVVKGPDLAYVEGTSHPESPVWLVGNSFTAGAFREHLAASLGLPVHSLASNGGSATGWRESFVRDKNKGNARVVVWAVYSAVLVAPQSWKSVLDPAESRVADLIAASGTEPITHSVAAAFGSEERPAMVAPFLSAVATVAFAPVPLSSTSTLSFASAFEEVSAEAGPVELQVLADGKPIASRQIPKLDDIAVRDTWVYPWEVSLSSLAGTSPAISIKATCSGAGPSASYVVGSPTVLGTREP